MYFESRLALQKRRIAIAHENYRECSQRCDSIIERMRSCNPDQRTLDYLSGLAEAALEQFREAFAQWNAEIDALHHLHFPTDNSYQDYRQAKGYCEEGDYLHWEPQDWTQLEPESVALAPGAMNRGELEDFDYSDIEEF